jgi:hypothetical protein
MYEPFVLKEIANSLTINTYLYFILVSVYILLAWLSSSIYSRIYKVKNELVVFHFSFFGFILLPWICKGVILALHWTHRVILKFINIIKNIKLKPVSISIHIPTTVIHFFAIIGYVYVLLVFIKALTYEWFLFIHYHMIQVPEWLVNLTNKLHSIEWIF